MPPSATLGSLGIVRHDPRDSLLCHWPLWHKSNGNTYARFGDRHIGHSVC